MTRYIPSQVSCKYGAPMGRHSTTISDMQLDGVSPGKLYLQRVRLNSGGYDSGGAYWGLGEPLYVATDHDNVTVFVRAAHRAAAKYKVAYWLAPAAPESIQFHR